MEEGHGAVGGEDGVHRVEVWSARGGRRREQDEGSAQDCGGCDGAEDDESDPGQLAFLCCEWMDCFDGHTSPYVNQKKVRKY